MRAASAIAGEKNGHPRRPFKVWREPRKYWNCAVPICEIIAVRDRFMTMKMTRRTLHHT